MKLESMFKILPISLYSRLTAPKLFSFIFVFLFLFVNSSQAKSEGVDGSATGNSQINYQASLVKNSKSCTDDEIKAYFDKHVSSQKLPTITPTQSQYKEAHKNKEFRFNEDNQGCLSLLNGSAKMANSVLDTISGLIEDGQAMMDQLSNLSVSDIGDALKDAYQSGMAALEAGICGRKSPGFVPNTPFGKMAAKVGNDIGRKVRTEVQNEAKAAVEDQIDKYLGGALDVIAQVDQATDVKWLSRGVSGISQQQDNKYVGAAVKAVSKYIRKNPLD